MVDFADPALGRVRTQQRDGQKVEHRLRRDVYKRQGFNCGACRLPLGPMDEKNAETLRRSLEVLK